MPSSWSRYIETTNAKVHWNTAWLFVEAKKTLLGVHRRRDLARLTHELAAEHFLRDEARLDHGLTDALPALHRVECDFDPFLGDPSRFEQALPETLVGRRAGGENDKAAVEMDRAGDTIRAHFERTAELVRAHTREYFRDSHARKRAELGRGSGSGYCDGFH